MLDYLVTSKVRRLLLQLLWEERERGTAAELAERAGLAYAGVHSELKHMLHAQLAVARRDGAREVYEANLAHPLAGAFGQLVARDRAQVPLAEAGDDEVRRQLVALGAPLRGVARAPLAAADRVTALVAGCRLAHRDPTVARCLPLCVWTLRDELAADAFSACPLTTEDKHTLGFFLELTATLGGAPHLTAIAASLRDRRATAVHDFFHGPHARLSRDFELAARWGFRMNTDLASFEALFTKFA